MAIRRAATDTWEQSPATTRTVLTWLVFADAIAVGVLALADLTVHEATTEKVVHQPGSQWMTCGCVSPRLSLAWPSPG